MLFCTAFIGGVLFLALSASYGLAEDQSTVVKENHDDDPRFGSVQPHESGINSLSGWDPIVSDFRSPLFNWTYYQNQTSNIVLNAKLPDQIVEVVRSTDRYQIESQLIKQMSDVQELNSLSISANGKFKMITGSASYSRRRTAEWFQSSSNELVRTSSYFTTHEFTLAYDRFPLTLGFTYPIREIAKLLVLANTSFVGVNQEPVYAIQQLIFNQVNNSTQTLTVPAQRNIHILETINYELDMLLLKFGPEYIWRVVYGGSISIDSIIDRQKSATTTDDDIKTSASLGFASYFGIKVDSEHDRKTNDTYEKMISSKIITIKGGLPWNEKTVLSEWQKFVPIAPAVVGYETREIVELINTINFPDIDSSVLFQIRQLMIARVLRYYHMNTFSGCLDRKSLNYCWFCNKDDSFCQTQDSHLNLGGYYRTGYTPQVNHLTQQNTCPTNYTASLLFSGSYVSYRNYQERVCHHRLFRSKKCRDEDRVANTNHPQQVYFCTSNGGSQNGYYFGGAYADGGDVKNQNTNDQGCGPNFDDEIIFYYAENQGIHVCLKSADEVTQVPEGSQKFGGIFNCQQTNPMTGKFACAQGYMKHPLGSHQNCDWFYCVGVHEMKHGTLYYPPGYGVRYPNFPREVLSGAVNLIQVSYSDETDESMIIIPSNKSDTSTNTALIWTLGLSIPTILIMLLIIFFLIHHIRKQRSESYYAAILADDPSRRQQSIDA